MHLQYRNRRQLKASVKSIQKRCKVEVRSGTVEKRERTNADGVLSGYPGVTVEFPIKLLSTGLQSVLRDERTWRLHSAFAKAGSNVLHNMDIS